MNSSENIDVSCLKLSLMIVAFLLWQPVTTRRRRTNGNDGLRQRHRKMPSVNEVPIEY